MKRIYGRPKVKDRQKAVDREECAPIINEAKAVRGL